MYILKNIGFQSKSLLQYYAITNFTVFKQDVEVGYTFTIIIHRFLEGTDTFVHLLRYPNNLKIGTKLN